MNGGQTIFSTPSISSIRSRSPFASWYAESSRRLHFQFPAITGVLTMSDSWLIAPQSSRPVLLEPPRVRHRQGQHFLRRERTEGTPLQLRLAEHPALIRPHP